MIYFDMLKLKMGKGPEIQRFADNSQHYDIRGTKSKILKNVHVIGKGE